MFGELSMRMNVILICDTKRADQNKQLSCEKVRISNICFWFFLFRYLFLFRSSAHFQGKLSPHAHCDKQSVLLLGCLLSPMGRQSNSYDHLLGLRVIASQQNLRVRA